MAVRAKARATCSRPGAVLSVEDGARGEGAATCWRVSSRESAKTRDITGGLPRVAELFEARIPKDSAIIAKVSGRVVFGKDYKAKRKIGIQPEDGGEVVEYLVSKSKVIDVQEGDYVKRGDNLIGGSAPTRTTSWKRWGSSRWPSISCRRSRRSIVCRA